MVVNRPAADRRSEWFVPAFGPPKFRILTGLLFLPYTAMVLAFAVIGSLAVSNVAWDRVAAIVIIYFLGLGIAAHSLDAIGGGKSKPWGTIFTPPQLWLLAAVSLVTAYVIAGYYILRHVPWLAAVAVLEGFFVFAYNLEWFEGRFHTDGWFAFSWGFLPVTAGCLMQTNSISLEALVTAASMALFSMVEIKASRHYKVLKQKSAMLSDHEKTALEKYEAILKSISGGVILLAMALMVGHVAG